MGAKILSQEFGLKDIDEKRSYFIEEIDQSWLMSKIHKKVCTALNYIEQFLTISSMVTGCVLL